MIDKPENTTEHTVKEILADRSGIAIDKINADTNIFQDLALDSLDFVEAIMEFEEKFGIAIPDNRADGVKTVGEVTAVITELLEARKN